MWTIFRKKVHDNRFPFLLFGLALALTLPYTLWYANNPDSYQYISLARKWANGNFAEALNGYWSPLLSWLIALPLSFGINGILCFKLIQIVIGFFTIDTWIRIISLLDTNLIYKRILSNCIIPFVLVYATLNLTADLLFMTCVLYLLLVLIKNEWIHGRRNYLFVGLLGALLYFAKAFGFPLFIFMIFFTGFYFRNSGNRALFFKNIFSVFLVFVFTSMLWIIPLSLKYGKFTISKAASFNMSVEVAPMPGQIMQLPVLNGPLLNPPDANAISAWEAPGDALKLTPLTPFSSKEHFDRYIQLIKRNILTIWYFDFRNQTGIIFLCLLLIFLSTKGIKALFKNRVVAFLLATFLVLYGGYGLILVHTRYIWLCTWIMLLISAWILQQLSGDIKWSVRFSRTIFIVLILIAVKRPLKELFFTRDSDLPHLWLAKSATHPFETLEITYRPEKRLFEATQALENILHDKDRIASLQSKNRVRHSYSSSLFICEALKKKYFGPLSDAISIQEAKAQLLEHDISIFFVWDHENWEAADESWAKIVYTNKDLGLDVYQLSF